MKDEYSVECENCGSYNISPIKCEECWKKKFRALIEKKNVNDLTPPYYPYSENDLRNHIKKEILKELEEEKQNE